MFQRIFGSSKKPSNTKKKHTVPATNGHSPTTTNNNNNSTSVHSDTDDSPPPVRHFDAAAVTIDPVPAAFKSPMVAPQKSSPGVNAHKSGSFSSTNGISNFSFGHNEQQRSSPSGLALTTNSNHNGSKNNSFHSRSAPSRGGGGLGDSQVNYWRLPWSPQRVTMCPYCRRPQAPNSTDNNNLMSSRQSKVFTAEADSPKLVSSSNAGTGKIAPLDFHFRDDDTASTASDSSAEEDAAELNTTYCRCANNTNNKGSSLVKNNSVALSSSAASPPVFVVETKRTSQNIMLPGAIADDSSSDDDEDDTGAGAGGHRKRCSVKLSLVSPLTTHTLMRASSLQQRSSLTLHPGGSLNTTNNNTLNNSGSNNNGANNSSSYRSVSSWVHEQQTQQKTSASPPMKRSNAK